MTPLLVAGRYEVMLTDLLGKGGLATVYRARDADSGDAIAAKRLNDEHQTNPDMTWRFRREARMTSHAHHDNIVGFVDHPEDSPWIMLDLVEGENLKRRLEREGPQALHTVESVVTQMADALDHLHSRGVVHLDIKPQNIIVTPGNHITLIDFGLAQEFADAQDKVGEDLFGTAAYMAPEQAAGRPVNERTDVYALGCVFYELVTGRPPFEAPGLSGKAEQHALIEAHATEEPQPPSVVRPDLDLPAWVDDVADRALAKDPVHRFAEAGAFARAVQRGLGLPERPSRQPTERLNVSWRRRSREPDHGDEADDPRPDETPAPPATPRGPGLMRRTWAAGGRRLRESPAIRRVAFRAAWLALVVSLILGLNVAATSGLLADVIVDVVPAMTTEVMVTGLNLREEPTTGSPTLTVLPMGANVTIAGGPERAEGRTWWPVTVQMGDGTRDGWVSAEGIEQSSWMQAVAYPKVAGDWVRDKIAAVSGWIP